MNTNDQIFFNYQMSKAIFSIIDCLSVLKQEYNSTYNNKLSWALEQDEFKGFLAYINFADQIKLKGLLNYKFSENKELFVNIGNKFSLMFELGLQKHYNNKLSLPDLVKFVYGNSFKTNIMKLLYFLKGINGFNLYNMILAQYFIFESTLGLRNNSKDLKKIMYKFNQHKSNLDSFRIDIATKRIEN